jgi:hypothetical protein
MNPNNRQTAMVGVGLIVLGVVWWLNLWWLVGPGALAAAGVLAYRRRRSLGRPVEAVQAALWCFGLSLILLTGFWFGVIFLAGLSLLLRGRELQADAAIQQVVSQARTRRSASRTIASQRVPITTQAPAPLTPDSSDVSAIGATTRLGE